MEVLAKQVENFDLSAPLRRILPNPSNLKMGKLQAQVQNEGSLMRGHELEDHFGGLRCIALAAQSCLPSTAFAEAHGDRSPAQ